LEAYDEQKIVTTLTTNKNGEFVYIDTESSFYRDANSLRYASVDNVPSPQAVDRLVADVNKQLSFILKISRFSSLFVTFLL
jgi:hypothetical protein